MKKTLPEMNYLLIESPFSDALYNLALEEYLFKSKKEDNFILTYINEPSVIIGKHQNAYAEINYLFTRRHRINVLRRLSGGGTVYHDKGNINFTFIKNIPELRVDFEPFLLPVCGVLNEMGLKASIRNNNDILLEGFKISGNAQHIFNKRLIHHGTLLFASNLNYLNDAIKGREAHYESNAVHSKRSMVANISDLMQEKMDMEAFCNIFLNGLQSRFMNLKSYRLTRTDHHAIGKLVGEKYTSWAWNYGYSPDYKYTNSVCISHYEINTSLLVKKGIIKQACFNVLNLLNNKSAPHSEMCNALVDKKHREADIFQVLKKYHASLHIAGVIPEELCLLFF